MGKQKIHSSPHDSLVIYDTQQWTYLKQKRAVGVVLLQAFHEFPVEVASYGSVARGDVSATSDIDIVIFDPLPSFQIERLIEEVEPPILERRIVMATPNHAIKGQITIERGITISFPLIKFTQRERDFYTFAGKLDYSQLIRKERVVGVDKRLMLIQPNPQGHRERALTSVTLKELVRLGFPQRLIEERKRVLTRRNQIGRTGVFLDHLVSPDEGFDHALQVLASHNSLIRRKIRTLQ
ncbi:MAG: nucleotidyltransferase domain-containing protein [Candidatus Kariarchaeaceae archaeon]|jgi:predicted nucleotidyltransferase